MVLPSICLAAALAGPCCTQQHNAPRFLDYGGRVGVSGALLQRVPRQEREAVALLYIQEVCFLMRVS